MDIRVPAVLMRGGSSKGLFIRTSDLPADPLARDAFLLAAYGSPDPDRRQIDGVGGATSVTSKLAVVGPSTDPSFDVTYEFGQVSIDRPLIDRRGTCGNMSIAVGPFAIDELLVEPVEPSTRVRILNVNTNSILEASVPVRNGRFDPAGELRIPGVPSTGAPIRVDYLRPAGAVTGSLLPTGSPIDSIRVPGVGTVEVSIVDAANPMVFVRWEALGLSGDEAPERVDDDPGLLRRLEAIRAQAAIVAGLAGSSGEATALSPAVPKLVLVGPPMTYSLVNGRPQPAEEMSIHVGAMSMGRMHRSVQVTGALCIAVAAHIDGTLIADLSTSRDVARIGHPSGVTSATAQVVRDASRLSVTSAGLYSTARRLMEGAVVVPDARVSAVRGQLVAAL